MFKTVAKQAPTPVRPLWWAWALAAALTARRSWPSGPFFALPGPPNPDPSTPKWSKELLERINALDIGPQGLGGRTTALAVHIEVAAVHMASLPVAVNINCHVTRHESEVL